MGYTFLVGFHFIQNKLLLRGQTPGICAPALKSAALWQISLQERWAPRRSFFVPSFPGRHKPKQILKAS